MVTRVRILIDPLATKRGLDSLNYHRLTAYRAARTRSVWKARSHPLLAFLPTPSWRNRLSLHSRLLLDRGRRYRNELVGIVPVGPL